MSDLLTHPVLVGAIASYGVWIVLVLVGLESLGLPLPGETVLVTAALYAGATGTPDIALVVGAATLGAILGDNAGYALGRRFGLPLLVRHGASIGLGPPRIRLGRYLFARYGAAVVFLGRFFALLRAMAAFLAGTNDMPWPRFVIANAAGALLWASIFGFGAWWLGQRITTVSTDIAIAGAVLGAAGLVAAGWATRRYGSLLQKRADESFQDAHSVG